MSETRGAYGRVARAAGESKWGNVAVPRVEHEDRMAVEEAEAVWNRIYSLFRAAGEEARNEVKLAVYAYYAVNGSSPQTPHSKDIVTGGGVSVASADVLDAIGSRELIRRFLRAHVEEAYSALKESEVLATDDVYVAKVADKGIPRQYAYCGADFLRGCGLLMPVEKDYADRAFNYSVQRARSARGGRTVEQIDEESRDARLTAQREVAPVVQSRVSDF